MFFDFKWLLKVTDFIYLSVALRDILLHPSSKFAVNYRLLGNISLKLLVL
jgi:hypothetical protein